jgi:phospholipid/cholesterol/gamma-HCH transport system substrate-binding protein
MRSSRILRLALALILVVITVGGTVVLLRGGATGGRTTITAYFKNSNGIYPGDDVRILGVPVGAIDSISPEPDRVKITFWVDSANKVPADAEAVILSPTLVTARFIQLTPVYAGGPQMKDHAVIPGAGSGPGKDRTAEPVEWDDLRASLAKLNKTLQPAQPGGVSSTGAFVNTLADNLRGQGANIRDAVLKLSQALSILGDHSGDVFGTVKNLSVLVSALSGSTDLLRELNGNLADVTGLLSNDPDEVGTAVADLNAAVSEARSFIADNREALGSTSDRVAELTTTLNNSLDDVKQALHVFPTALSNFTNIYQPAHAAIAGALSGSNFANPIQFLCGAIQAASRLNAEESSKLCVQYLAPILKNRQYNFLGPVGFSGTPTPLPIPPFLTFPVGAVARPNEITFSEDRLRPDFVPPLPAGTSADAATGPEAAPTPAGDPPSGDPLPAEALTPPPAANVPDAGLPGMMLPTQGGSR